MQSDFSLHLEHSQPLMLRDPSKKGAPSFGFNFFIVNLPFCLSISTLLQGGETLMLNQNEELLPVLLSIKLLVLFPWRWRTLNTDHQEKTLQRAVTLADMGLGGWQRAEALSSFKTHCHIPNSADTAQASTIPKKEFAFYGFFHQPLQTHSLLSSTLLCAPGSWPLYSPAHFPPS